LLDILQRLFRHNGKISVISHFAAEEDNLPSTLDTLDFAAGLVVLQGKDVVQSNGSTLSGGDALHHLFPPNKHHSS
jgi:hypothetical protein